MKRFFFHLCSILLSVILMASCSNTKDKELLQLIPKDADAVFYINLKKIAEAGQIKKLKTNENVTKYYQEEFGPVLESFLNNNDKTGVDFRADIYGFTKDKIVYSIFSLNNETNFKATLEKLSDQPLDFQKEGNYTYAIANGVLVAWDEKTALFLTSDHKKVSLLDGLKNLIELDKNETILENTEVVNFLNAKKALGFYVNSSASKNVSFVKGVEIPEDCKAFVDLDFEKGKINIQYRTILTPKALEKIKDTDVEQKANQQIQDLRKSVYYKLLAGYGLEDVKFSGNAEKGQLEIILTEKKGNSLSVILNKLVAFL